MYSAILSHVFEKRKFVMAKLQGNQGLLCDKIIGDIKERKSYMNYLIHILKICILPPRAFRVKSLMVFQCHMTEARHGLCVLVTTRPMPYLHQTSSVLRRSPLELLSITWNNLLHLQLIIDIQCAFNERFQRIV